MKKPAKKSARTNSAATKNAAKKKKATPAAAKKSAAKPPPAKKAAKKKKTAAKSQVLGCCTLMGNGPAMQIEHITREACRLRGIALDKNDSWVAGECAESV